MISRSWPPAWKTLSTSRFSTNRSSSGWQVEIGLGVDRRSFLGTRDLDQAEVGPIGVFAHELGVHGDERLLRKAVDEGFELGGLGNQGMDLHEFAQAP